MFYDNSNGKFVPPNGLSARALKAKDKAASFAAQNAAGTARDRLGSAAQSAATAAQLAAQSAAAQGQLAAKSAADTVTSASRNAVRQGVYTARDWAAPRLETAADLTTDYTAKAAEAANKKLAPKVSGALRNTARQVRPEKNRGRTVLQAILISIAALAGAGAIAVLVQRQRTKAQKENDVMDVGDASEPTSPVPGQTGSSAERVGVPVNGQASSSGW